MHRSQPSVTDTTNTPNHGPIHEPPPAGESHRPVSPGDITSAARASFDRAPDERLRFLLQRLVEHLHAYAVDVSLTRDEWAAAVAFLTETGRMCSDRRQEFVLLSDTLGLSMLVDAIEHPAPSGATESTVLGPFHVEGSPLRPMGSTIAEQDGSGEPVLVSGTVRDTDGRPVADALIDVWQNAANELYAVQDTTQPPTNLRGRFTTGDDGAFAFWAVRPVDYRIPDDGPVGQLLSAAGRRPWRPAHLHLMVSAPEHRTVATHFFDRASTRLDDDAVFGVKPSLVVEFVAHGPEEPGAPEWWPGTWYTLERDVVLVPQDEEAPGEVDDSSTSPAPPERP